MPREHEWDSRWWSPIINAEHLAMRERAGMVDLTAFSIFDVVGPGASTPCSGSSSRRATSPVGRVIYTPVLDARGGFRSDLTVMRLGDDRFRVVTGGAHGQVDRSGSATGCRPTARAVVDLTTGRPSACGARGPATSSAAHP